LGAPALLRPTTEERRGEGQLRKTRTQNASENESYDLVLGPGRKHPRCGEGRGPLQGHPGGSASDPLPGGGNGGKRLGAEEAVDDEEGGVVAPRGNEKSAPPRSPSAPEIWGVICFGQNNNRREIVKKSFYNNAVTFGINLPGQHHCATNIDSIE